MSDGNRPISRRHRKRRRPRSALRAAFERLFIEPLETRCLLTTDPLLAPAETYAFVSSVWFQALSQSQSSGGGLSGFVTGTGSQDPGTSTTSSQATDSEWIVRLTADALNSIHSVS